MTRIPSDSGPRRQPPGPPAPVPTVPPPANPRPRRPAGRVVVLAAGALALLLGAAAITIGITRHGKPTATVQTTPTCAAIGINGCQSQAAISGSPAQHPGDPAQALPASVTQACDLNDQIRKAATNEDLRGQRATISQIQALAGDSAVVDIKVQANILKSRYDTAVTATDDPASYAATTSLFTASTQLSTACVKAGWKS